MGLLFVTPDAALGVWLSLVPALALAIDRSLGEPPSWPLGAHGVALLQARVSESCQAWVAQSREQLRTLKLRQVQALQTMGWLVLPSETIRFIASRAD